MEDVICLSSDDSDVEIVGSFGDFGTRPPLSEIRVDLPHNIDLSDPRWAFPNLIQDESETPIGKSLIDLTDDVDVSGVDPKPPEKDSHSKNNITSGCKNSRDECEGVKDASSFSALQVNSGAQTPKQRRPNSSKQHKKCYHSFTPAVKLEHLSKAHVSGKKALDGSDNLKHDSLKKATCEQVIRKGEAEENLIRLDKTTRTMRENKKDKQLPMNCSQQLKSLAGVPLQGVGRPAPTAQGQRLTQDDQADFSTLTSSFQNCSQKRVFCSSHVPKMESKQSCPSDLSSLRSCATSLNSSKVLELDSLSAPSPYMFHENHKQSDRSSTSTNVHDWQFEKDEYKEDMEPDSSVSLLWQNDGEHMDHESKFGTEFRAASREDRRHVCPVTLKKIIAKQGQIRVGDKNVDLETSVVLCRQSLSLVYSTIDESYPESTLQLLSDLLQPGYHPPKDITTHLLRGILLEPQCPFYLCVQAFNLLMRTQRHHMATKSTVPWDWELLTFVMSNQGQKNTHRSEVVCMFLEYTVQTLEDDFYAKWFSSALRHSLAKAALSCEQHFSRVRDVIKWLFSAIVKSTEQGDGIEAIKKQDEQIRIVSLFQRMLALSLEVDRSPALTSAKLSQELFHILLSNAPLRAHRMLLLNSLQSKLLRCKLLEHLLDFACPQKISVPMSLNLLLHFLKNCTLASDPADGTEKWQKWEELIHLLWMLLLSYNKAMKGYLSSSFDKVGPPVYKPDDMISKLAVRGAVEAFQSRSLADLGQALPLHVEESLTYLQDQLLDVCQC